LNRPTLLFPAHTRLAEPKLLFHPTREEDSHEHPLVGLVQYGPFSRSLVGHVMEPIRLGTVVPAGESGVVDQILRELEGRHQPQERKQYLIDFPGFSRVFGVRLVRAPQAHVELPAALDQELARAERPHYVLAEQLTRSVSVLRSQQHEFDVVLVYLPVRWARAFVGGPEEDFDLHDHLKATTAMWGMPLQILREDKAMSYPCRCSVTWRLGIALYCKAGGVPWKLANAERDTAYIGVSYAVRSGEQRGGRFVTCCSQVFDADGAGLEFILYEPGDVRLERDNPYLSRADMRGVMARSLALYQRRHAGRVPVHVVVHKSTPFTTEEVDGCFDAWRSAEGLDLVHVQQDTPWRGVKIESASSPRGGVVARYPCDRGTCLQIGDRDALLWTQGNSAGVASGRNYYKEGKGIPRPLLLRRFAGHGTWDDGCRAILGLTKMDWNNDGLYDRLPVTLGYAGVLARTVKRIAKLTPRPYQLRLFM